MKTVHEDGTSIQTVAESPATERSQATGANSWDEWRQRGSFHSVFHRQVFVVDEGPPSDPRGSAEPLLILHGFPTSSFDFYRCLGRLSASYRVVVHDHHGFGLSAKPALYSYSLIEQADTALALWRQLGIRSGHLLGHDYGTSVATELLARRERGLLPIDLKSVTLTNGSVHIELARLRLSQRIARSPLLGPLFGRLVFRGYFKRVMRRLWADPRQADDADLEAMWQGVRSHHGHLRTHQISSYIAERTRFRHRWIGALTRLDLSAHVLWGRQDPVAVAAIARKLADEIPDAELTWLDDAGHYPMLEEPGRWSDAVLRFLARVDSAEVLE